MFLENKLPFIPREHGGLWPQCPFGKKEIKPNAVGEGGPVGSFFSAEDLQAKTGVGEGNKHSWHLLSEPGRMGEVTRAVGLRMWGWATRMAQACVTSRSRTTGETRTRILA